MLLDMIHVDIGHNVGGTVWITYPMLAAAVRAWRAIQHETSNWSIFIRPCESQISNKDNILNTDQIT